LILFIYPDSYQSSTFPQAICPEQLDVCVESGIQHFDFNTYMETLLAGCGIRRRDDTKSTNLRPSTGKSNLNLKQ